MTTQSFRDDYIVAKKITHQRVRAWAGNTARGRLRFERLIQLGADGYTIEEAAATLGMTVGGVRSNARAHCGSTLWPISGV